MVFPQLRAVADSLAFYFQPIPLPRGRAIVTLLCTGFAFLAFAGVLEYAAGSPDAQTRMMRPYWLALFATHFVAFGGAALLGWFPNLDRAAVKLLHLLAVLGMLAVALVTWRSFAAPETLLPPHWPGYAPALVALLIGLTWRSLPPDWAHAPPPTEPDEQRLPTNQQ